MQNKTVRLMYNMQPLNPESERKQPTIEFVEKMNEKTKNIVGYSLLAGVMLIFVLLVMYVINRREKNKKIKKEK